MSEDRTFVVTVRQDKFQNFVRHGFAQRLQEVLLAKVQRLAIEVQRAVKSDKLSGQVLHALTGTLRRSVNQKVTQTADSTVASVGTNVEYAGVHEFGFDDTVTVKEHIRRSREQIKEATYTSHGKKRVSRRNIREGSISVKQHKRHMKMPERSFLRSTLRDFNDRIREELMSAPAEAWRE